MSRLAYLMVLLVCLVGVTPLEFWWPGTRVLPRLRRFALSVLPVLVVFVAWDLYAISQQHWSFDPTQTIGLLLPGDMPIEELLFFLVIPFCAVMTLEAVRRVTGWRVGDER